MISVRPNHIAAALFLACLATSAYFFAQGSTSLLATKLFGESPTSPSAGGTRTPGAPAAATRPRVNADDILARNIFAPIADTAPDGGTAAATTVDPGFDPRQSDAPPCPADLRVLGAMIHPVDEDWSYAALAQGQTSALLYRNGQTFAGKTVYLIDALGQQNAAAPLPLNQPSHRVRVVLREPGGGFCQAVMFGTGAAAGAGTATQVAQAPAATGAALVAEPAGGVAQATPPGSTPGGELTPAELDQGITRNSPTAFTVQRSLMERAIAQQDSLFRSSRLIPNEANGTVNGMKVYGIRRSSVLGRLGIMNGDVLQSVNGQPMNTADALMQAYSSLGTTGAFAISVVRSGQPMTINYTVQ